MGRVFGKLVLRSISYDDNETVYLRVCLHFFPLGVVIWMVSNCTRALVNDFNNRFVYIFYSN